MRASESMTKSKETVLLCVVLTLTLLGAGARAEENERGQVVFELCVQCHGERGEGDALALAPAIAGLGEWYVKGQLEKFRSGIRGLHADDIAGLRMYPMSQMLQNDEDLAAVSAYVANLPPTDPAPTLTGGAAARGKARYATCAGCHGAKAEGVKPLGSALTRLNDWYLLSSLEKYKAGIRPADPKRDPQAAVMIGLTAVFPDTQSMKDVIAYIETLRE